MDRSCTLVFWHCQNNASTQQEKEQIGNNDLRNPYLSETGRLAVLLLALATDSSFKRSINLLQLLPRCFTGLIKPSEIQRSIFDRPYRRKACALVNVSGNWPDTIKALSVPPITASCNRKLNSFSFMAAKKSGENESGWSIRGVSANRRFNVLGLQHYSNPLNHQRF